MSDRHGVIMSQHIFSPGCRWKLHLLGITSDCIMQDDHFIEQSKLDFLSGPFYYKCKIMTPTRFVLFKAAYMCQIGIKTNSTLH